MKTLGKIILVPILILLIISTFYKYKDEWKKLLFETAPCSAPLTYSIGNFDERFGITKDEFIQIINESEEHWEEELGKQLFTYKDNGEISVNLAYDYRQETTDQLNTIGGSINTEKQEYNNLKLQYESMKQEFTTKKTDYEKSNADYQRSLQSYNSKVSAANRRGGANPSEYQDLNAEQSRLNKEAQSLNKEADELNAIIKNSNTLAEKLNTLARKLNIKVETFNTIGASTGEEFNEAEYIEDRDGKRINVYQFETKAKLRRVLMHELGHALGLDHVSDPDAIMYRLNSSDNEALTNADIAELKFICNTN